MWISGVLEQVVENAILLAREADQQLDLSVNSSKVGRAGGRAARGAWLALRVWWW